MNSDKSTEKSLVAAGMRWLRHLIFGDRRLLPEYLADPMWHVETMPSRIRGGELVVRFDNLDTDMCLDARSDLAARALGEGVYEPNSL